MIGELIEELERMADRYREEQRGSVDAVAWSVWDTVIRELEELVQSYGEDQR